MLINTRLNLPRLTSLVKVAHTLTELFTVLIHLKMITIYCISVKNIQLLERCFTKQYKTVLIVDISLFYHCYVVLIMDSILILKYLKQYVHKQQVQNALKRQNTVMRVSL